MTTHTHQQTVQMPRMVDTHCHLDMIAQRMLAESPHLSGEDDALRALYAAMQSAGVGSVICIATNELDSLTHLARAQRYPWIYTTIGIHPCDCTGSWQEHILALRTIAHDHNLADIHSKMVAIGEIGLDFYHPGFNVASQTALFKAQIELALELDVPVVIHTRNAFDETLAVLTEYRSNNLRGVVHCFSEGIAEAQNIIDLGLYLGIGGTLTYPKNDTLRAVVQSVGINRLVLETDAPFLPPQHIRGKLNTPAQIATIAQALAHTCSLEYATVAQRTTENAYALFTRMSL